MPASSQQIHRSDGELIGELLPTADGQWVPATFFGVPLHTPLDAEKAESFLHAHGLSYLAQPWELLEDGQWLRVQLDEASPERVVAQIIDINRDDLYAQRRILSRPLEGILRPVR